MADEPYTAYTYNVVHHLQRWQLIFQVTVLLLQNCTAIKKLEALPLALIEKYKITHAKIALVPGNNWHKVL